MFPSQLPSVSHRESYTQQVSLKIGVSLEQQYMNVARQRGMHVNHVYREALVSFVASPQPAQDSPQVTELTQRLSQLEAENALLRQNVAPVLSPTQEAYKAFENELVIAAVRDIAERVENADIEYTADAILEQFVSFIPPQP